MYYINCFFIYGYKYTNFANKLQGDVYVETLQSANPYQADTVSYALELSAPLEKSMEIRNYFRLDSLIQGCSSVWEKAISVAQVAATIKHYNSDPLPTKYNAIDLWEWAKEHPDGFNCRHHSILLHELLLAVGIENRVITCSPKDTADTDCHVVNAV